MVKISRIKNQIKAKPAILLQRPWMVLYMPIIIATIFLNRLKKSKTIIYLTETSLCEISFPTITASCCIYFKIIDTNSEFSQYAQRRIAEDKDGIEEYSFMDDLNKRFARGDFAIACLNGEGIPLSYVFIATQFAVFLPVGMSLQLPEQTFGMYDVYTYKESRGKGHYHRIFEFSVKRMQEKGYKKIWLWLMAHNTISVRVHNQLGLKHVIKILTEKMSYGIKMREIKDVEMALEELIV